MAVTGGGGSMRTAGLCAALLLLTGACQGSGPPTTAAAPPAPVETPTTLPTAGNDPVPSDFGAMDPFPSPPPIQLAGGGRVLSIRPYTYCWRGPVTGGCADGTPDPSPPDIGAPERVELEFAAPGWTFRATAVRFGAGCEGRTQTVTLRATGPTTYRLEPIGAAGDYVITLFGRGGEAAANPGDVAASFRWHTPRAGPNEAPTATASIVAGRGQDVSSYGVEVSVRALRATPRPGRISGAVRVTSANDLSTTIPLDREEQECATEGSVYFTAPDHLGSGAAALGPPPFRYEVALTIDGTRHLGTAVWPDDMDPECSPCTRLRFSPALPGL